MGSGFWGWERYKFRKGGGGGGGGGVNPGIGL